MMEFDMDVVRSKVLTLKKKYSLTKYILGFATVAVTLLALPFIRIILQANGTLSTAIATVYWLFITRLGFTVILYPWWLVVAKSITYSDRLSVVSAVVVVLSMTLVTGKSLLAPADLYRYESDSAITTLWYRVVATLFWLVLLLGSFLVVPLYVRRTRLLKSKSWTLYSFVIPFVMVMLGTAILHEWGGDFKWLSYSIPMLIIFFGLASAVDFCSHTHVRFDEAYIMVAGFIPFWLGSVLGKALLTIFDDLGPLGSLFIFGAWKSLIFLFEVLSTTVGKKASRYNDGSVFAFCVIYTGRCMACAALLCSALLSFALLCPALHCTMHVCVCLASRVCSLIPFLPLSAAISCRRHIRRVHLPDRRVQLPEVLGAAGLPLPADRGVAGRLQDRAGHLGGRALLLQLAAAALC
jgi:hypothetical protein